MTNEEIEHEDESCWRFFEAQREYIRIVEEGSRGDGPEQWAKANAALEELWAAYQASTCACAQKPSAEREPKSWAEIEARLSALRDKLNGTLPTLAGACGRCQGMGQARRRAPRPHPDAGRQAVIDPWA